MGFQNIKEMKLFAFLAAVEASVWIHPEVRAANRALGIPMEELPGICLMECMFQAARESIRCEKHDHESPEYTQCLADVEDNAKQCISVDGCIQADGTCANRCIPKVEEDIYKCESDHENGLLTDLEFAKCIKKAEADFSNCFDVCTCEMPWCNCTPPSSALASPFDVVCYPQ